MIYWLLFFTLLARIFAQDTLTVPVAVDGNQYEITFSPRNDPVDTVARNFCIQQRATLRIEATEEAIGACADSVSNYIVTTVNNAIAAERAKQAAAAQNQGQLVRVPISIDNNQYEIRFSTNDLISDVSVKFCVDQRENLKIASTNEAIANCANVVSDYIVSAFNRMRAESTPNLIRVPITVDENTYEIRFSENDAISAVSRNFCIQQRENLRIEATEVAIGNCATSVSDYLLLAVNRIKAGSKSQAATPQQPQRQLTRIPLNVGDVSYEIRYYADSEAVPSVAAKFCVEQKATLGIEGTEAAINNCANSVTRYIEQVVAQRNQEGPVVVRVPLTANNNNYEIRFAPEIDALPSVASNFCVQQRESLGIAATEADISACSANVADYLQLAIRSLSAQQQSQQQARNLLKVQLTVDDNTYEITYEANKATVVASARNFCSQQAENLRLATEGDLARCVASVADYLLTQIDSRK